MTQEKSESLRVFSEFTTRTDVLAAHYKIRVVDLPSKLGFSEDMLMGYRTGRHPISLKAWRKLEAAEIAAGLRTDPKKEVHQILQEAPADIRVEIQTYLSENDAKFAKQLTALDARIAALDAALAAQPAIAEAIDAGLTIDEVRAMIRAEAARRRDSLAERPFVKEVLDEAARLHWQEKHGVNVDPSQAKDAVPQVRPVRKSGHGA